MFSSPPSQTQKLRNDLKNKGYGWVFTKKAGDLPAFFTAMCYFRTVHVPQWARDGPVSSAPSTVAMTGVSTTPSHSIGSGLRVRA